MRFLTFLQNINLNLMNSATQMRTTPAWIITRQNANDMVKLKNIDVSVKMTMRWTKITGAEKVSIDENTKLVQKIET